MTTNTYRTFLVPKALTDRGISAYNTIDAYGLMTFGFQWLRTSIWATQNENITTTWTNIDF